MHLKLSHCIEKLAKAGRAVHIEYSKNRVKITYEGYISKNIIPFGQTRLTEFAG